MLKCSHTCFVEVILKYGPHSHDSIIWEGGEGEECCVHVHPCCRPGQKLQVHPCCRLCGGKNKSRSLSSITVSSIVEVTMDNQRSASGSAALELRRSGAPSTPEKTTLHKSNVHNMRRAKPEQQWV